MRGNCLGKAARYYNTRVISYLKQQDQNLTSLSDRIAAFIVDRFPPDGSSVELLCVDHNGTYVVPFPCHRVEDAWRNFETNEIIKADVAASGRGLTTPGDSLCELMGDGGGITGSVHKDERPRGPALP